MTEDQEKLGELIYSIDNLAHMIKTPVAPEFHVECLREILPARLADLKAAFVAVVGHDPWSDG